MIKSLLALCFLGLLSCKEPIEGPDMSKLKIAIKCCIDTITSDPWFQSHFYDYLTTYTIVPHINGTPPDSSSFPIMYKYYHNMSEIELNTKDVLELNDAFPSHDSIGFTSIETIMNLRQNQIPPGKISYWIIGEIRKQNDLYYIEVGYSLNRLSGEYGLFIVQIDSSNYCKILEMQMGVS